ncbi:MAG: hypothetical protein IJK89_05295 [Clostridia bacterium]|nr:hypothetical protein [Clostridia bacterium]
MPGMNEYKCPCCGGAIAFDSSLQKMRCPYCDTEFEMSTLLSYDQALQADANDEIHWEETAGTEWQPGETEGMRVYLCNSCGGEIVCDENTAASKCPYCDNPVVMTGQFRGALKPDYVIPFKLDKNAAKAGLRQHFKGKTLLPKVFSSENHIDEIKGVYVPFWLFDADVNASIRYRATRTRHWSDRNYDYTETSYFMVNRGGSVGFDRIPVDGSSKIDNDLTESVEPFNFAEAVNFQTAYLAGYLADKYDVTAEQSAARANERVKASTEQEFAKTVQGYETVVPENSNLQVFNGKAKYALYPIWLLNTTWNGKKYTFAMNGQTGKFVGDLPVDKGKLNKIRFLVGLGVAAAAFAVQYIIWLL